MILDAKGKKFRRNTATASAVVFVSIDAEKWTPLKSDDVPACIRDPRSMGQMLNGEILETTEPKYYRAERLQ